MSNKYVAWAFLPFMVSVAFSTQAKTYQMEADFGCSHTNPLAAPSDAPSDYFTVGVNMKPLILLDGRPILVHEVAQINTQGYENIIGTNQCPEDETPVAYIPELNKKMPFEVMGEKTATIYGGFVQIKSLAKTKYDNYLIQIAAYTLNRLNAATYEGEFATHSGYILHFSSKEDGPETHVDKKNQIIYININDADKEFHILQNALNVFDTEPPVTTLELGSLGLKRLVMHETLHAAYGREKRESRITKIINDKPDFDPLYPRTRAHFVDTDNTENYFPVTAHVRRVGFYTLVKDLDFLPIMEDLPIETLANDFDFDKAPDYKPKKFEKLAGEVSIEPENFANVNQRPSEEYGEYFINGSPGFALYVKDSIGTKEEYLNRFFRWSLEKQDNGYRLYASSTKKADKRVLFLEPKERPKSKLTKQQRSERKASKDDRKTMMAAFRQKFQMSKDTQEELKQRLCVYDLEEQHEFYLHFVLNSGGLNDYYDLLNKHVKTDCVLRGLLELALHTVITPSEFIEFALMHSKIRPVTYEKTLPEDRIDQKFYHKPPRLEGQIKLPYAFKKHRVQRRYLMVYMALWQRPILSNVTLDDFVYMITHGGLAPLTAKEKADIKNIKYYDWQPYANYIDTYMNDSEITRGLVRLTLKYELNANALSHMLQNSLKTGPYDIPPRIRGEDDENPFVKKPYSSVKIKNHILP